MEALVTLLFFVALWGLARVLKHLAPRSAELGKLSQALTGGPAQSEAESEASGDAPPPAPGQQHTPEAQPDTTTKPTP